MIRYVFTDLNMQGFRLVFGAGDGNGIGAQQGIGLVGQGPQHGDHGPGLDGFPQEGIPRGV